MEPSVEGLGIPQPPKVPPCPDERVLHSVFRRIPVTEDPSGDRVQALVCSRRESIEGLVVAPLCAFDEFGRHADPLERYGHLPYSQGMSLRPIESFRWFRRTWRGAEPLLRPFAANARLR